MGEIGEHFKDLRRHRKNKVSKSDRDNASASNDAKPQQPSKSAKMRARQRARKMTIAAETPKCRYEYSHLMNPPKHFSADTIPNVPATNGRMFWNCYPSFQLHPGELALPAFLRLAESKTGWTQKAFEENWIEYSSFIHDRLVEVEQRGLLKTLERERGC